MCALLFLTLPRLTAQAFEVATIKPAPQADPSTGTWSLPGTGGFTARHGSPVLLLQLATEVDASQIANKPAWLESDLFDVAAKPEAGVKLSRAELKPRLQELLRQRFHLVAHMEMRSVRGYALVVAPGGPHLSVTRAERSPGWKTNVSPGQMRGINWSMPTLARYLTPFTGFPVEDKTGLPGSYDIDFSYAPEGDSQADSDSALPSLAAALEKATGLALKPQKVAVETVVIDSMDRVPTEN